MRLGIRRGRSALCTGAILLAISLCAGVAFSVRLILDRGVDAAIAALAAGRDVPVATDARPELLFARLAFLTTRDRFDEAQPLMNRIAATGAPRLAAAAFYDLSNGRLRVAIGHLESNDIDPAVLLVRLAKEGYRRALMLDPGFWDAKYNLDVAMRLVRDFPQIETSGEEIPPEAAKRLWTDLPGVPRGLP
ncbi:hypothetical protein GCM10028812_26920 [Ancylobacter sonchi]|uniref:hypothetical protein n=1 Tax=Ancylobacter sonchi TaxID=1937790 RepID=UPI001FE9865E|nr:hypothetical protein [Ancylobacter sonchi]